MKNTVQIVVLAAGKGKRMQSDGPKVLVPLAGRHMIRHLLESVHRAWDGKPVIVVGHMAELVKAELGNSYTYATQTELLGTGYAMLCAKAECADAETIVVLQGDQPFTSPESIKNLIKKHTESGAKITLATTVVKDFLGERQAFNRFGRILRVNGEVVGVKEYKDASEEERMIKEVNAGCYAFNAPWLWANIDKLKNNNAQQEYYLTDMPKIAQEQKEKIETMEISNHEALAANTKEELEILERVAPN